MFWCIQKVERGIKNLLYDLDFFGNWKFWLQIRIQQPKKTPRKKIAKIFYARNCICMEGLKQDTLYIKGRVAASLSFYTPLTLMINVWSSFSSLWLPKWTLQIETDWTQLWFLLIKIYQCLDSSGLKKKRSSEASSLVMHNITLLIENNVFDSIQITCADFVIIL